MPVTCPRTHPYCPRKFESVLDLQFHLHLQDAFGVKRSNDAKIKRLRHDSDDIPPSKRKKTQGYRNNSEENDSMAIFQTQHTYNTYIDSVKRQLSPRFPGHSQELVPSCSSSSTTDFEDGASSGYSTPLSPVLPEEGIDPTISLPETWLSDTLEGCTAANSPLEATADTLCENQGRMTSFRLVH